MPPIIITIVHINNAYTIFDWKASSYTTTTTNAISYNLKNRFEHFNNWQNLQSVSIS